MKVEVTLEKWGTYSKGETLNMDDSTARACIKSGSVKEYKTTSKKAKK